MKWDKHGENAPQSMLILSDVILIVRSMTVARNLLNEMSFDIKPDTREKFEASHSTICAY